MESPRTRELGPNAWAGEERKSYQVNLRRRVSRVFEPILLTPTWNTYVLSIVNRHAASETIVIVLIPSMYQLLGGKGGFVQ